MLLKNHIASRFLSNTDNLIMEMVKGSCPEEFKMCIKNEKDFSSNNLPPALTGTYFNLCNKNSKNYVVTNSVIDKLEMLKIIRDGKTYNWTVFKKVKEGKYTFILPANHCLRMCVYENTIWFSHITGGKIEGNIQDVKWVNFYFDRFTGEFCSHYEHKDVKDIEPFIYALLCFVFLTENDEIELKPNQKTGTKKSGKVINTLSQNITIINSRWNTTTTGQGFGVSGHFRLQRCGTNWQDTEIIFINPFVKEGITRKAKSELVK